MSFGQLTSFGFGSNGSGGGGGGSQGLLLVTGVCGEDGGPAAGETVWVPDAAVLVGATLVNFIIVNNNIEMSVPLSPYNNFSFNDVFGSIDRSPNQYALGDTVIVPYKPAAS